ncbi:MAG: prolipoprotein diacylglyceryl transferase family protein [Gemmataceae bacterium]
MMQVLYRIPITQDGIPIYGFGMMLFLAFILCTWLASRLAEREGISRDTVQDLALWIFIGGLLGARITYLLNENPRPNLVEFVKKLPLIWEGGIVLYGSVLGGTAAFFLAYFLVYRRRGLRIPLFLDSVAPAIALGLALGRIGCFLNGCCYGQVACAECPVVLPAHFPLSAPCRDVLVHAGVQTAAGFTQGPSFLNETQGARVGAVDPASPAYAAGLRPGAVIVAMNGMVVRSQTDLANQFASWPRGQSQLTLEFLPTPKDDPVSVTLVPRSLGLYPTQLYETVSMTLLLLVLLAYAPFRFAPGQVCAVLMVGYGIHRYLNEILRDDPRPKGLESYGSLFLIVIGVLLWLGVLLLARRRGQPTGFTLTEPSVASPGGESAAIQPAPPPAPAQ